MGVQLKEEKEDEEMFTATITKDCITSTEPNFEIKNFIKGSNYDYMNATFIDKQKAKQEIDNSDKGSIKGISITRFACQIYEDKLLGLSKKDKDNFKIRKAGIFTSKDEYKKKYSEGHGESYFECKKQTDKILYFYHYDKDDCILFLQECLAKCGNDEDTFEIIYKKSSKSNGTTPLYLSIESNYSPNAKILLNSKNIIFHGAPGTGKTYLAKEIAAELVSNGTKKNYSELTDEEKKRIGFVQFHPSYDYTDFVEGLRPKIDSDTSDVSFELRDGIFKKFIDAAKQNFMNSKKSKESYEKEQAIKAWLNKYLDDYLDSQVEAELKEKKEKSQLTIMKGTRFQIEKHDENYIYIHILDKVKKSDIKISKDNVETLLAVEDKNFQQVTEIKDYLGEKYASRENSYELQIYKEVKNTSKVESTNKCDNSLKNYVFIIDEINRGEISKIFGELFFSIDPGYRGEIGSVDTQYSNLHEDNEGKFYIPENVYIIGTMNDIDRSVDSFDFAMRRRFRFIELKAKDAVGMLKQLDEDKREKAEKAMNALNDKISNTPGLNDNYHIGPSYFLKLKDDITFEELYNDYLSPLLIDYVRGFSDEDDLNKQFKNVYDGAIKEKVETKDEQVSDTQG